MKGISILLSVAALFAFVQEGDCRGRDWEGRSKRIMGGNETSPGQFPWMVAIVQVNKIKEGEYLCGASLVTCRHALSSARLLLYCSDFGKCLAVVGSYEWRKDLDNASKTRRVAEVITHEDFDGEELKNDIAVVVFDKRVAFGPTVSPVCLAPPDTSYEGKTAIATGWGDNVLFDTEKLLQVSLPILPRQSCSIGNRDGRICAGYLDQQKGLCWKDFGDPLVVREGDGEWVLVGVASDFRRRLQSRCSPPGKPPIFTDVAYYNDWILPRIDRSCDEDLQQPHF